MITIPTGMYGGGGPTSIANLQCWLRSDLGITLASGKVSTWANQVAGVSGDATQATTAKQPAYSSSGGINNRPKVTFSGAQGMQWALSLDGSKTLFSVIKLASEPHSGYSVYSIKKSATIGFTELLLDLSGYQYESFKDDYLAANAGVGHNDAYGSTTAKVHTHTFIGGQSPTDVTAYTATFNGVSKTIVASGSMGRTSTDLGSLGSRMDSGGTCTFCLNGEIYEIAVYSRILTSYEQAQLWLYAKARYAL